MLVCMASTRGYCVSQLLLCIFSLGTLSTDLKHLVVCNIENNILVCLCESIVL